MPPKAPANLDAKGRAARKAALTQSIKIRENQIAKWRLYVRDEYLNRAIAKLEAEVAELQGQRQQLDQGELGRSGELAESYLGFQRYDS